MPEHTPIERLRRWVAILQGYVDNLPPKYFAFREELLRALATGDFDNPALWTALGTLHTTYVLQLRYQQHINLAVLDVLEGSGGLSDEEIYKAFMRFAAGIPAPVGM